MDLESEPLLRLLLVDLSARGYSLLRARPAKNSGVLDFASASIDELLEETLPVYPLGAALSMAAESWVRGLADSGGMDAGSSSAGVAATVVAALQGQFAAIESRLAALESAGAAVAAASTSADGAVAPAFPPPLAAASRGLLRPTAPLAFAGAVG